MGDVVNFVELKGKSIAVSPLVFTKKWFSACTIRSFCVWNCRFYRTRVECSNVRVFDINKRHLPKLDSTISGKHNNAFARDFMFRKIRMYVVQHTFHILMHSIQCTCNPTYTSSPHLITFLGMLRWQSFVSEFNSWDVSESERSYRCSAYSLLMGIIQSV